MENDRIDNALDRLGAAIDNLDNRVSSLAVALEVLRAEQQARANVLQDRIQQVWNGPDLNTKEAE